MNSSQVKNVNGGLKILLVFLIFILICLSCVCYYEYSEYKHIKDNYEKLESKYTDVNKKNQKLEEEKKQIEEKNKKLEEDNKSLVEENKKVKSANTTAVKTKNYIVKGNKHVYDSEYNSSVYAENGVMYLASDDGLKKLNIDESIVNKAVVRESAQGTLAYIIKQDGIVVRYYYGAEFNQRNAFTNYRVKNLVINCKGGENGPCSIPTYKLTLLDGSIKIVNSDK